MHQAGTIFFGGGGGMMSGFAINQHDPNLMPDSLSSIVFNVSQSIVGGGGVTSVLS